MIVRELITRLGFSLDQKGADQYDRRLRKLRDDAEKSAKKLAADEAQRISRMARAEAAVARLRGAQFKALQETERRETNLEQLRARGRERAERHQRSMDRMRRTEERQQQRSVASIAAARQRENDAQRRRALAMAQLHAQMANQQLRAVQVRAHAERRLDLQVRNAAQRQAMATARAAAFDQRQAHMRRAELLREQNIRLRNQQIARQTRAIGSGSGGLAGGLMAGGAVIGGGFALAGVGRRVDEMSTYSTRLNSQFDPTRAASRDAELQRIAMLSGVSATNIGTAAYKTMRSATSVGITGMNEQRAFDVTEAVGLGAALSGSSPEATNAALVQLFQGIESNRLGGEEIRSVMEQTPELARAIMEGANYKDLGEFRAASKAGDITGRVVIEALEKALPDLRARAGEIPITFGRTFAQLSTMLNYYLLDAQKAADITGKFNKVIVSLATMIEKKSREIIANMGGWEIAVEKVIAVIAGTMIPVLLRLGITIMAYMGPLALLAAPLTLIFSSMLEFARLYPDEWAAAMTKIKSALGNLVDSVLYALGMRLKPYNETASTKLASVAVENRGNGVVGYGGKDYRADSRELLDAILADRPDIAAQMKQSGGRMRVMGSKGLLNEVQQLPGGEVAGSTWPAMLEAIATGINALAESFTSDDGLMRKSVNELSAIRTTLDNIFSAIPNLFKNNPNLAKFDEGVQDFNKGNAREGWNKMNDAAWSAVGEYFNGVKEGQHAATKANGSLAVDLRNGAGYGSGASVRIDKIEVQVKEASTKESFIKAVDSAGKAAIENAIGRSSSGPLIYPIEDTSRATE